MTELLVRFKLVLIIFITTGTILFGQSYPDRKVDELLRTGIDKIIQQDYLSAKKIFTELDSVRDDLPLGKIYLAATEIAMSFDLEIPFNHSYITQNLRKAESLSKELLKKNPDDLWNKYFLALTEGYFSYYDAVRGSWLNAVSNAVNSISLFEEILEKDSSFHDAYIAIGTFKYWKSAKTEFLSWLPFVSDEKSTGIEYLNLAIRNSSYNYHLAVNSLIWIYIDRERFGDAIELATKALDRYPQSRIFRWGLARAYENINVETAIREYQKILKSYLEAGIPNRVNIVTLKHIIAQQYVKIGRRNEALKLCDEILSIRDFSDFEKEKLDSRLKRIKKLKEELIRY